MAVEAVRFTYVTVLHGTYIYSPLAQCSLVFELRWGGASVCGVQMFGCMLGLHIVFLHRGVSGIVSLGICSDSTKRTRSSFGVFDV